MSKMKPMIKLENWSITARPRDPYQAPELWGSVLAGKVFGHPEFQDGSPIWSSLIKEVDGRIVKTHSGSVYTLGKVSEDYVKWCEENKFSTREKLEGETPIKWR